MQPHAFRLNSAACACYLREPSAVTAMPDLLLELFSEEIPARMQARAAEDLRKLVTDRLVEAGLVYEGAKAFVTPRRLALAVQGVPVRAARREGGEEGPARRRARRRDRGLPARRRARRRSRRPRSSPTRRATSTSRVIEKPGRPAIEVIGRDRARGGARFPVAEVDALGRALGQARRARLGAAAAFHRRHLRAGDRGAGDRRVRDRRHRGRRRDARPSLHGAGAVQGAPARRLRRQARKGQGRARPRAAHGRSSSPTPRTSPSRRATSWSRTKACLAEVAGLVEWPVVLMGSFDEAFLAIPPEVIRTTIRNNQKCFVLRDPKTARARQQVHPGRQHRGRGRRQGDRRRQRARHPRAAVRRQVLLRDRPEDAAGRPAAEIRRHRLPREARHAGRAHRAHRAAAAELAPLVGADVGEGRSARRSSPRPTCSPRWSANSPSCRG